MTNPEGGPPLQHTLLITVVGMLCTAFLMLVSHYFGISLTLDLHLAN